MRGRRAPSPGRNWCGRASLHAAICPSVIVPPSPEPTSVATSPVEMGDVATLVGSGDGGTITLGQIAAWSGALPHEVLAGLRARPPRIYGGSARRSPGSTAP